VTAEQRQHFREKLVTAREQLNRQVVGAQAGSQEALEPMEAGDDRRMRSDLADSSLRLGTVSTEQMHEIDDALLRMEVGEYGICEECGNAIEIERLELVPAARLCVDDARDADRSRKPPTL
jgi:DnaK suppressor protein